MPILADRGSAGKLAPGWPCCILRVFVARGLWREATGRVGEGAAFSVATNTLFTCLHTDSLCRVPPQQQTTTRQWFWFIDGTLDDLLVRFQRDFDDD